MRLETTSTISPASTTSPASTVRNGTSSMPMDGLAFRDPIGVYGDVHHILPEEYLKSNGFGEKGMHDRVANHVCIDTRVDESIGKDAPRGYLGRILRQCADGEAVRGNMTDADVLGPTCVPTAFRRASSTWTAQTTSRSWRIGAG